MKFEKAKEILENEVANICDEELSEALEVVLNNSIPKKKIKDKKEKLKWVENAYMCHCYSCEEIRDEGKYFAYKELLEE